MNPSLILPTLLQGHEGRRSAGQPMMRPQEYKRVKISTFCVSLQPCRFFFRPRSISLKLTLRKSFCSNTLLDSRRRVHCGYISVRYADLRTIKFHGSDAVKPNHHFATHIAQQIRNYGPVYSFWCFLPERLNRVLKGYNSNGAGKGQLEISMLRAFSRESRMFDIVSFPNS